MIGNTPIVQLTNIPEPDDAAIFAKLEYLNPGGSVKDRIGVGMIARAERDGVLARGGTIIEPTAGNTGIALALVGVRMGYRVILCVPENFSVEKREVMKALGGEVELTPKDDGMKGAIARAEELAKKIPNAYIPQQFVNPYNTESHYETTAPEIYQQMEGRVDAFVTGSGTGGTFTGVAKYLRERIPGVYCVIVEPQGSILKGGEAGPHEVEGIGASSFIPTYAVYHFGMSPQFSGSVNTPRALVMIVTSIVASMWIIKTGYRLPMVIAVCLISASLAMLGLGVTGVQIGAFDFSGFWFLATILTIGGFGMGLSAPSSNNAALDMAPDRAAALTGVRGMFRLTGGILSIAGIVLALTFFPDRGQGLVVIYGCLSVAVLGAVPLALSIPDTARERWKRARSGTVAAATEQAAAR